MTHTVRIHADPAGQNASAVGTPLCNAICVKYHAVYGMVVCSILRVL